MKFLQILIALFFTQNLLNAQIAAPNLRCVKRDTLIWDVPSVSCGTVNSYLIYSARNINGPYQVLATITNTAQTRYFHNNTEGGNWFYFMETNANCAGQSRLQSDTLDNQPPSLTSVLTLNVVNSKTVEVRWRKNPTPEVTGYIVYKKTNSGLVPIANVPNRDTVHYFDTNASPALKNEEYQVLAVDACGNTSLFDVNHQTILLKTTQSKCEQAITLKWNLYKNWVNPISKQEVWVGVAGRNPTLFASVGAKDTAYVYKNAKDKTRYFFYIKAIEAVTNISSKSNDTTIIGNISEPVKNLFIKNITVNKNNQVDLTWLWNATAKIDSVEIYRRTADMPFTFLKSFKPVAPIDDQGFYTDVQVNAGAKPYYYYIKTTDECKAKVSSNTAGTMHLTGFPAKNGQNTLRWTLFDVQDAVVTGYQIVRIVNNAATDIGNPIDTSAPREYLDVSTTGEKNICYRVGAYYRYKLPDGSEETAIAYSNTICLSQFANVWVPNAFTPGGNNPVFKPVFTFSENISEYRMTIFDRWGGILFDTTNPLDGWEGKRNGSDLPQGTYSYIIRLKQAGGSLYENKGVLMLLR